MTDVSDGLVPAVTEAGLDFIPAEDVPTENKTMAEEDEPSFPRLKPANHPTVRELFARFASSGAHFYPHMTCADLPSHRLEAHRYRVFPEDNKLVSDPLPDDCILDDPVPAGDQVNQEDVYCAYAFWDCFTHRANVLQIIVNVYRLRSSE
jgi:hypothetical protein